MKCDICDRELNLGEELYVEELYNRLTICDNCHEKTMKVEDNEMS